MRRNWRAGRIGWVLGIHSHTAHVMETCWCIGTKREKVIPNLYTKSRVMADLESYYRFISTVLDNKEEDDDRR